jgi:hypothetical protein
MSNKKIDYGKLPISFKKKWIKALRSGDYKQGKEALIRRNEDKVLEYCCLGLATCISGIKTITINKYINNGIGYIPDKNILVPKIIRGDNDLTNLLANKNDGNQCKKQSFKQIANWIENNL